MWSLTGFISARAILDLESGRLDDAAANLREINQHPHRPYPPGSYHRHHLTSYPPRHSETLGKGYFYPCPAHLPVSEAHGNGLLRDSQAEPSAARRSVTAVPIWVMARRTIMTGQEIPVRHHVEQDDACRPSGASLTQAGSR